MLAACVGWGCRGECGAERCAQDDVVCWHASVSCEDREGNCRFHVAFGHVQTRSCAACRCGADNDAKGNGTNFSLHLSGVQIGGDTAQRIRHDVAVFRVFRVLCVS